MKATHLTTMNDEKPRTQILTWATPGRVSISFPSPGDQDACVVVTVNPDEAEQIARVLLHVAAIARAADDGELAPDGSRVQ